MFDKFNKAFLRKFPRLFCIYIALIFPFVLAAFTMAEQWGDIKDTYRDLWAWFKAGKVTL